MYSTILYSTIMYSVQHYHALYDTTTSHVLQAWITEALDDPKTKIVLVDSELAHQALALNSPTSPRDDMAALR